MRLLLLLLVLAIISGGAAWFYRADLSMRALDTVLQQQIAYDIIVDLPDGLHIGVCGAGGPLPSTNRSGPCLVVIAGDQIFAFDAGTNGVRNMQRMGISPGALSAIFLTHFHSDHIDGLGEMMMLRWTISNSTEPVPVIAPVGVEKVVDGINAAYELDAEYRLAHHGEEVAPISGAGGAARPFEPPTPGNPIVVHDLHGVTITAFTVSHEPVVPAVGYKVEYGGRSLVISGDTSKSEELERMADSVDLIAHEALSHELVGVLNRSAAAAGRHSLVKITDDILSYHTSPVEAAEIANRAGASHLLLYHVIPPLPIPGLDAVFMKGVKNIYPGGVTLSEDGTFVSLPTGSHEVLVSDRL